MFIFIVSTLIMLSLLVEKIFFFNLERGFTLTIPGILQIVSLFGLIIAGIISFVKSRHPKDINLFAGEIRKVDIQIVILLLAVLAVIGVSFYLNLNKNYIHWDAIALYDARAKFLEAGMKFSEMPALSSFDNLNKYYYLLYPPFTSIAHYLWRIAFDINKLPLGIFYTLNLFMLAVGVFLMTKESLGVKAAAFLTLLSVSNEIIFSTSIKEYTNLPYTVFIIFGIFFLVHYIKDRELWKLLYGTLFVASSIWIRFLEPVWLVIVFSLVAVYIINKNFKIIIFPICLILLYCTIEYFSWSYFTKIVAGSPGVLNFSAAALIEPLLGVLTGAIGPVLAIFIGSWGVSLFIYLVILAAVFFQLREVSKDKETLFLSLIILLSIAMYFLQLYFVSFQTDWWKATANSIGKSASFLIPISGYILLRLLKKLFPAVHKKHVTKDAIHRLVRVAYLVFPFGWLVAVIVAGLKIFFALNALEVNKYLNPNQFFIAVIVVGALAIFYSGAEGKRPYALIYKIVRPILFVISILYIWLSYLEYTIWPNFVFNKFHIHLSYLLWTLVLVAVLVFIKLVAGVREKGYIKIFCILMICVLISNFFKVIMLYVREVRFMINYPRASYEDRMKFKVGDFFIDYVNFIKYNTRENSIILIPPQGYPWPQTGNGQYMSYFLYPRVLINGREKEPGAALENIDYVLLDYGETLISQYGYTNSWPKFDVPAEEIIYLLPDGSIKTVKGNYYFSKQPEKAWGIIKVRKVSK